MKVSAFSMLNGFASRTACAAFNALTAAFLTIPEVIDFPCSITAVALAVSSLKPDQSFWSRLVRRFLKCPLRFFDTCGMRAVEKYFRLMEWA